MLENKNNTNGSNKKRSDVVCTKIMSFVHFCLCISVVRSKMKILDILAVNNE